jgi:hypothetical protein
LKILSKEKLLEFSATLSKEGLYEALCSQSLLQSSMPVARNESTNFEQACTFQTVELVSSEKDR